VDIIDGQSPPSVQRDRTLTLEDKNGKLKRLVADLTLDKIMLQDVLKKISEARHSPGGRAPAAGGDGSPFLWTRI
jgi:hypothetical protein